MAKKRKTGFFGFVGRILLDMIKIPYYILRTVYRVIVSAIIKLSSIIREARKAEKEEKIEEQREKMKAQYSAFIVVQKDKGDLDKWESNFYSSDNKIGIILGARGSGKTALGIKLLENTHTKNKKKCYAIGFEESEMPDWIDVVDSISQIENDSVVLIDEGGVLFSSRKAMTNINKMLSDLILISRHKNIIILFISQNSSNLDVNIIRQADFLVLKPSSLLQKDFERKIIGKLYDSLSNGFKKYQDTQGLTYIYSDDFRGFVTNPLPSFWKSSISKSFRKNKPKN
jgi:hypothetical protein